MKSKVEVLLRKLNFEFNVEEVYLSGCKLKLYKFDREESSLEHKVISKYIVIDFTEENISLEDVIQPNNFHTFQELCFAPEFFEQRSDLRWNIYAILLVDKYDIKYNYIENDDNYVKKVILKFNELDEYLTFGYLGKLARQSEKAIKTNFVLRWENALLDIGLAGCVYNQFLEQHITNYLANKPIHAVGRPRERRTSSKVAENLVIDSVKGVSFSNFRKYCFGNYFEFSTGTINLFSGSNGSGKTSLCESIELGLTGKIKGEKVKGASKVTVKCMNRNGELVSFNSSISQTKQRELDLTWYGTTTTGNKSRLNENFLIFNYLYPNTFLGYIRVDHNLNDILKNLMYGVETTEAQKKLKRFKEGFAQRETILKKQRKEFEERIKNCKDDIINLKKSLQRVSNFEDLLKKTAVNDDFYGKVLKEEKILSNIILNTKNSVDKLNNYFSTTHDEFNHSDLKDKSIQLKVELCKKKREINKLIKDKKTLHSIKESITRLETKRKVIHKAILRHKELNELLNKLQSRGINNKREMSIFQEEFRRKTRKQQVLDDIYYRFNDILCLTEHPIIDYEEYRNTMKHIKVLEKEIIKKKRVIEEYFEFSNTNSNILKNLKDFGLKYILQSKDNNNCPLCNHEYKSYDKLLVAVSKTEGLSETINDKIIKLKNELNLLEKEVRNTELKRMEFEKKIEVENRINKLESEVSSIAGIERDKSLNELIRAIESLNKKNKVFLENNEYTNKVIHEIQSNQLFVEADVYEDANVIMYFHKKVRLEHEKLINIVNELHGNEKKLINLSGVEDTLKEKTSEMKLLSIKLSRNENAIDHIMRIRKYFNIDTQVSDFKNWLSEYKVLENVERKLHESSILSEQIMRKNANLEEYMEHLEKLSNKIYRCQKAIKAIKKLPAIEDDMKIFIDKNSSNIEKIFKLVHLPKEFSGISINKGKVEFIRKSTNQKTDITEVSTGQGVALVFAITLCLHLSAKNAPKIIIFDEPVANMDDMHIANLVDIIRELCLMGIQIFITTANTQVSNYLRRKFSFFGKSFKHFIFDRVDENPTIISESSYSPLKKSPIDVKNLLSISGRYETHSHN